MDPKDIEDNIPVVAVDYEDLTKEELIRIARDKDKWADKVDGAIEKAQKETNKAYQELNALQTAANKAIDKLDAFHKSRFDALLNIIHAAETLSVQFTFIDKED